MNSLNELRISAKIRRMIDLVLEQDTGDFIPDEICGLNGVVALVEVVVLDSSCGDSEL